MHGVGLSCVVFAVVAKSGISVPDWLACLSCMAHAVMHRPTTLNLTVTQALNLIATQALTLPDPKPDPILLSTTTIYLTLSPIVTLTASILIVTLTAADKGAFLRLNPTLTLIQLEPTCQSLNPNPNLVRSPAGAPNSPAGALALFLALP